MDIEQAFKIQIKRIMPQKTKLHLWVEEKLKDMVYKEAQKRDMSISSYVRYVLRKETEK